MYSSLTTLKIGGLFGEVVLHTVKHAVVDIFHAIFAQVAAFACFNIWGKIC